MDLAVTQDSLNRRTGFRSLESLLKLASVGVVEVGNDFLELHHNLGFAMEDLDIAFN